MSIHHRLSVLAGDRPWHPVPPPPPRSVWRKSTTISGARPRWRCGPGDPGHRNAHQRVLSAAGWQLPLPDRLCAHFPGMPQWAGTHCCVIRCPVSVMLQSKVQTVAPCRVVWVLGPPATVVRAAWETVHRITDPVSRSPASVLTSSSAVRIAMSAARVLERRLSAATRISRRSTDLMMTSAPPPPRDGDAPLHRAVTTDPGWVDCRFRVNHESIQRGGCSERPRSQIGLGLGSNSATRRSGSSGARDSTELRIRPAITIAAWSERVRGRPLPSEALPCGVERGQPVIAPATARISRSSRSTLPGDVAGSHAGAAYSIVPLTYSRSRVETVISWASRRLQLLPVMVRRWARRGFTFSNLRTLAQCSQKWRRRVECHAEAAQVERPFTFVPSTLMAKSLASRLHCVRISAWVFGPEIRIFQATRPSDHGVCRLPCSSPCDDQAAPCAEGRRIVRISDGRVNYRKFRSIYRLLKVLFPG